MTKTDDIFDDVERMLKNSKDIEMALKNLPPTREKWSGVV
jgi:hypothetical protein